MPNLTRPGSWTLETCAALLASKDDSARRQLRVLKDGEVILSDTSANLDIGSCRFALRTWLAGTGYCGVKAAADKKWVEDVHRSVQEYWERGAIGVVDDS